MILYAALMLASILLLQTRPALGSLCFLVMLWPTWFLAMELISGPILFVVPIMYVVACIFLLRYFHSENEGEPP